MKKIKIVMFSLLLTLSLQAKDEKVDTRTLYHLGLSSSVAYLTETMLHQVEGLSDAEKIIYATVPVVAVGIAKELGDKKSERADMVANVVGAFAGAYVANYLNNNYFFQIEQSKSDLEQKTKLSMGYRF